MTEIAPSTRWDNQYDNINENEDDWEGGNNSAKLFERSRIKALAGMLFCLFTRAKILMSNLTCTLLIGSWVHVINPN